MQAEHFLESNYNSLVNGLLPCAAGELLLSVEDLQTTSQLSIDQMDPSTSKCNIPF